MAASDGVTAGPRDRGLASAPIRSRSRPWPRSHLGPQPRLHEGEPRRWPGRTNGVETAPPTFRNVAGRNAVPDDTPPDENGDTPSGAGGNDSQTPATWDTATQAHPAATPAGDPTVAMAA